MALFAFLYIRKRKKKHRFAPNLKSNKMKKVFTLGALIGASLLIAAKSQAQDPDPYVSQQPAPNAYPQPGPNAYPQAGPNAYPQTGPYAYQQPDPYAYPDGYLDPNGYPSADGIVYEAQFPGYLYYNFPAWNGHYRDYWYYAHYRPFFERQYAGFFIGGRFDRARFVGARFGRGYGGGYVNRGYAGGYAGRGYVGGGYGGRGYVGGGYAGRSYGGGFANRGPIGRPAFANRGGFAGHPAFANRGGGFANRGGFAGHGGGGSHGGGGRR